MSGTQWIIFDAVSGVSKGALYWPPARILADCGELMGPEPGSVFPPIGEGDSLAVITGESADEPALDAFVKQGHLHTAADLLDLYPSAVVAMLPALVPPSAPAGRDRRFAPGLGVVADFAIVTDGGYPGPRWDDSIVVYVVPGFPPGG